MRPPRRLTPFDRAASFLTCLIDSLSRPEALLLPHEQVEEDAEQGARELARLLLQGHFDLRARREEAELSALDTGGRAQLAAGRTRLEKGHRRQLATVVGPVTVTRCALRSPGLDNCYPADQVLGLPRERHSLGLRRLVVLEAVRGSYDHALEAVERRCGARAVGKRQAEQLVRAAAVDIAAFYAARTPAPSASTTLLVLSVDGKGIVMRPGHLREATRKAAERATRTSGSCTPSSPTLRKPLSASTSPGPTSRPTTAASPSRRSTNVRRASSWSTNTSRCSTTTGGSQSARPLAVFSPRRPRVYLLLFGTSMSGFRRPPPFRQIWSISRSRIRRPVSETAEALLLSEKGACCMRVATKAAPDLRGTAYAQAPPERGTCQKSRSKASAKVTGEAGTSASPRLVRCRAASWCAASGKSAPLNTVQARMVVSVSAQIVLA